MLRFFKDKCLGVRAILQDRADLKGNRGFTLVEIMVVLVIIAILSAISVATLGGITKSAREKAVMAEAKSVFTSAQVAATEIFAMNGYLITTNGVESETDIVVEQEMIEELLGRKLKSYITVTAKSTRTAGMGTIDEFDYIDNNANVTVSIKDDGSLYINTGDTDPKTPTSPESTS